MPSERGRNRSLIKTPVWVRDYLGGRSSTLPPGVPDPVVPSEGDYTSRMHQRLKLFIRSIRPDYQYPRRHSFGALINNLLTLGLLERTGQTEEPVERGAALGSARGFYLRTWVRLAPGSEARDEWADPIGYLARVYPGMRPAGLTLPTRAAPASPRARPPRPAARPAPPPSPVFEAAPLEVSELEGQVAFLNRRRVTLRGRLLTAAGQDARVEPFQVLADETARFLDDVAALYGTEQFADARRDLALMQNCITLLEQERELTQRRVAAVRNCQNSARVVAEGLGTALAVPEAPAPTPARIRRRPSAPAPAPLEEAPAAGVPTITLPERWTSRAADRLVRHLGELAQLDAELIKPEVKRLMEAAESWRVVAEDAQEEEEGEDNPNQRRIDRLTEAQEFLEQLRDALDIEELEPGETLDLETAIDILRGA